MHRADSFRWGVVAASFAAALSLRFPLQEILPPGFPFLTFFPAVIVTTYLAGLWPGIAVAGTSGLAAATQLGGTFDMVSGGGTICRVTFPMTA